MLQNHGQCMRVASEGDSCAPYSLLFESPGQLEVPFAADKTGGSANTTRGSESSLHPADTIICKRGQVATGDGVDARPG